MVSRRLRSIAAHIGASVPAPSAALQLAAAGSGKVLLSDDEVKTFLQRGWHIVEGPKLGLPESVHDGIYETGMDVLSKGRRSFRRGPDGKMIMEQDPNNELIAENVTSRIPAMQEVISSPAVSGALQSLLGEGYALHPHTFLHNTNAGMDQDFHKVRERLQIVHLPAGAQIG